MTCCSSRLRLGLCIRVEYAGLHFISGAGRKRERELGIRTSEAIEVRQHSWQELPLGLVPVFQRKCRRPNLWPPEEGDLVAPAYCPLYHLLHLMGFSAYGQRLFLEKGDRSGLLIVTYNMASQSIMSERENVHDGRTFCKYEGAQSTSSTAK